MMMIILVIIIIITGSQINSGGILKIERERRKKVPHAHIVMQIKLTLRVYYCVIIYGIYIFVGSLQFSPLRFCFASNVHSHHISKANNRLRVVWYYNIYYYISNKTHWHACILYSINYCRFLSYVTNSNRVEAKQSI